MTRGFVSAILLLALSFVLLVPAPQAAADGMRARVHHRSHWHHRHFNLPPERHVVEVNKPTGSGYYTINGAGFTAADPSCARWVAGERIKLLQGHWNGWCSTAIFYNVRRRQVCELRC
jgi:hypothetical protein